MNTTSKLRSPVRISGGALLLVLLLTGLIRYGLVDVPLERDEGEYAYAGQLILQGVPPYQEVYNMKMPGTYAAYAICMAVFGQSRQGIHTALIVINLLTVVIVYLLAGLILNRLGAITAAAGFAVLSVSQSVQGVFANAEHFVILFATGGLLVLLWGLATEKFSRLFAAAVLLGLSFLMKQHGAAFGVFAALYLVYDTLGKRPIPWRELRLKALVFLGGILSVLGCLGLIMAWTGVLSTFWFWTFDYASAYISQVPSVLAWQRFYNAFSAVVQSAPFVWLLAAAGLCALISKTIARRYKVFLMMFLIVSILAICPGFYFRKHYFILLLPCAGILTGVAISVFGSFLSRFSDRRIQYGLPLLLLFFCLGHSIYNQRAFLFHMTPFQVSRSTYRLNPFPESIEIARFVRAHTTPEDRIAILGSEPQIFFYAQRRSASNYIYMYPLMEIHDFALEMQNDFIKTVERNKPKFIIFVNVQSSWVKRPESHTRIFDWFNHYLAAEHFKLSGVVSLYEDRAAYLWEPNEVWPAPSKTWVAIFKRPG